MKIDERVYHEYANWKLENEKIIRKIQEKGGNIYFRFKHVIDVIDFYYNKLIDDVNYNEEDDVIFQTGFYYVADQLEEIKEILRSVYNNKVEVLNEHAKEINLFLNNIDFQTEILNNETHEENKDIQRLMDINKEIYQFIVKKEAIPEEYYEELDLLTTKIFRKLKIDYYPINNIFLEIADELNILE